MFKKLNRINKEPQRNLSFEVFLYVYFLKNTLMIFRILVTICLLTASFSASAQEEESQCVRIKNFSIEERNQDYPFNKAKRVVFASFK